MSSFHVIIKSKNRKGDVNMETEDLKKFRQEEAVRLLR